MVRRVGPLPHSIETRIWGVFHNKVRHEIEKKTKRFGPDIEDKLNSQVSRALKLRNGARGFVIKKEILELLPLFGVASSQLFTILPSPTPSRRSPQYDYPRYSYPYRMIIKNETAHRSGSKAKFYS